MDLDVTAGTPADELEVATEFLVRGAAEFGADCTMQLDQILNRQIANAAVSR